LKTCNGDENILQYYWGDGSIYLNEKTSFLDLFRAKYKPVKGKSTNGLVRIRFVVNCKGKANRFRTLQSDNNYNEIEFDERIVSQLVNITKGIDSWKIINVHDEPIDYYLYLIFKLENGHITEILP
jgi:hypothetical protein